MSNVEPKRLIAEGGYPVSGGEATGEVALVVPLPPSY